MYDVFFIDDESDIRLAIEQSFELEEISALFFSSAEDALLAIKQDGLPKVVISDICLPGLSGENLLSTVLHQDKDVPVILITGHGDISMAVNALRNGAYDFIEKPFPIDRLIDTTRRGLEKRDLTLENQELKRSLKASQTLGPRIIGDTPSIQMLREKPFHILPIPTPIFSYLVKQGQAKSWLLVRFTNKVQDATRTLSPSTVAQCLKTSSRVSSMATRKEHLLVQKPSVSVSLSMLRAEPYSLMRLNPCRCRHKFDCYASFRNA